MRRLLFLCVLLFPTALAAQQTTGLSGWSIVIDPGHSLTQNQGVFGYSEAMKTLAVGLELRDLLMETTDIDTVYMTRTRGDIEVSLTERTSYANQVGAAYFHSIHSDAGSPSANSTLIMYGGWRHNGQTVEKTPTGGKRMGDFMDHYLTAAMRIGRRGNYADRTFYQGFPAEHANQYPYLHVNRESAMASTLSEAGFHTNEMQNQRNMNADWKRLEARALYWSILEFHDAARPPVHIVNGAVRDLESGRPVNGATVEIAGKTYTTDTYESLFNQYSNDPNLLSNGFYYIEDLTAGTHQVTVDAEGFAPFTTTVSPIDTFFTYLDIDLVSTVPPFVATATPVDGQEAFKISDPIVITFSRPMAPASVESAFSITPEVAGTFAWTSGDRILTFTPDSLLPFTEYSVTLAATAESPFGYTLDGNADGTVGDAFALSFETGAADIVAPTIVSTYPTSNQRDVSRLPVISVSFSERIDSASVTNDLFVLQPTSGGDVVPGTVQRVDVGDHTVIAFAPSAPLIANTFYRFRIEPGLTDPGGNAVENALSFAFRTREDTDAITPIESFEGNFTSYWWEPSQSGSTTNIVGDLTGRTAEATVVNPLGGAQSMALSYGWLTAESGSFLIREYLSGGAPASVTIDNTYRLQAYVFGDGSGTQFRFALDDNSSTEVSPWYVVDWTGWRLVEWDLANEAPGSWIGNGVLEGNLRFDSFQLSYDGGAASGTLYIDDLRAAKSTTTAVEEGDTPLAVTLESTAPNPFADRTTITYTVPSPEQVRLRVFDTLGREVAVLVDASVASGSHRVTWDAAGISSGMYLVRLEAAGHVVTRSVTVLR